MGVIIMKTLKMSDMMGGWFIGDFKPSAYQTKEFEVGYKVHPKGEEWATHYHEKMTEINYLIRGHMTIQDTYISPGDIFILYPGEIADPVFHEDCELIVIKTPAITGDKVIIE